MKIELPFFGNNAGEPLDHPYEVKVDYGWNEPRRGIVLSKPSLPIVESNGVQVGGDDVIVNVEQPSGLWTIMMVNLKRIIG